MFRDSFMMRVITPQMENRGSSWAFTLKDSVTEGVLYEGALSLPSFSAMCNTFKMSLYRWLGNSRCGSNVCNISFNIALFLFKNLRSVWDEWYDRCFLCDGRRKKKTITSTSSRVFYFVLWFKKNQLVSLCRGVCKKTGISHVQSKKPCVKQIDRYPYKSISCRVTLQHDVFVSM